MKPKVGKEEQEGLYLHHQWFNFDFCWCNLNNNYALKKAGSPAFLSKSIGDSSSYSGSSGGFSGGSSGGFGGGSGGGAF